MTLRKSLSVLLILAFAVAAPLAEACERPTCGGYWCYGYQDLIYDDHLPPTCWVYSGSAQWKTDQNMCVTPGGGIGGYAMFTGGGSGEVYQNTVADAGGPHFSFNYTLEMNDPHATWQNELDVDILDANSGEWLWHVQTVTGGWGSITCSRRDFDLGNHANWEGRTLKVDFHVYEAYSDTWYKVSEVGLNQSLY